MEWGFLWLMIALKVPIALLFAIVWWAVRQTDDPEGGDQDDDGGTKVDPHGRGPLSRPPRLRGPHGGRPLPAPPRARKDHLRARPRSLPRP